MNPDLPEMLDRPAQHALLHLADEAIRAAVLGRHDPMRDAIAEAQGLHPALAEPGGVFVTIYIEEKLRGCLGEIEPEDPLAVVLVRCATRAPRCDYRFTPVEPYELTDLTFKVSVLSTPGLVTSLDEIRLGTHGLIARHEGMGGLLLPEVATEHGWDLETFLQQLWRKAGIAPTAPRESVKLWMFTTQTLSSEVLIS